MMTEAGINPLDHDPEALAGWFDRAGEKTWRARQVLRWICRQGVTDFARMSNLGKSLRQQLQSRWRIEMPDIVSTEQSVDGTRKWLLRTDADNAIETVFIPEDDRGTLCISSQAGCPLDCRFCATARQGFSRNLSAAEIIAQVWLANRELGHFQHGRRVISNVVFMGMGEPLLNYDNLLTALRLLTDPSGFALAKRKVTVSTAGVIPGIRRLARDSDVSLAVSLHAADDDVRDQLVPLNRHYRIAALMASCRDYVSQRSNASITIEYVMLHDTNDQDWMARRLSSLLRDLPAKVNLIPFNDFPDAGYQCSTPERIAAFRQRLLDAGLVVTTRRRRGQDIAAACGQLVGAVTGRSARHRARRTPRPGNSPA